MAVNQKRRVEQMWTRFEGDRHVTIAGGWDTSRVIVEGKVRVQGKAETEAMGYAEGKGKTMTGAGQKGSCKSGAHKGGRSSRQSVDGESLASRREMTTAEEVEDNLSQRMEKSEDCGSLECGGTRGRGRNQPPGVPIQVLGKCTS